MLRYCLWTGSDASLLLKSGKTPEETLVAYGELVNQRKYDRMYEMLSEQARERISEEEFTERNQKIYEGIEAENLTVQCEEEPVFEKGKKEAELSYTCEMESMAGKISFVNKSTFVKERGDWKINWDSTFIFPMLKEDYRVQINTRPAVRGNIYDRNGVMLAGQGTATEVGVVTGKMEIGTWQWSSLRRSSIWMPIRSAQKMEPIMCRMTPLFR